MLIMIHAYAVDELRQTLARKNAEKILAVDMVWPDGLRKPVELSGAIVLGDNVHLPTFACLKTTADFVGGRFYVESRRQVIL